MARIAGSLSAYGITRLSRLTDLDSIGIPVWNAVAPNARSITINQGKGIEDIDAKVSAAMEALERAVAGDPRMEVRQASLNELKSQSVAADPLLGITRAGLPDAHPDEVLDWTLGYDIVAEREVWVPFDVIRLDDTRPSRYWQSSDGLASGNTLLEATFHGLLERIERDAKVVSQFAPKPERAANCVDLEALRDPVLNGLAEKVCTAGFILQVFNMTSDVGVPCFEAFIAPKTPSGGQLSYIEVTHGAGAHPNPVRAVIRAVTEAAQSRLTYISGARDDIHPQTFSRPLPDHLREALFIKPTRDAAAFDAFRGPSLSEMLASVIARLRAVGITSAIVVDMHPGSADFSVAKVLVRELESLDGARKQRFGARALRRILRAR
ncbi:ribosomal protein S12 methylthiotransferase accessory factor [Ensifer adhaerens]|nr:ribosomal protein S12 methylthiotransferase accessory factor [Ensifer adhaerens]